MPNMDGHLEIRDSDESIEKTAGDSCRMIPTKTIDAMSPDKSVCCKVADRLIQLRATYVFFARRRSADFSTAPCVGPAISDSPQLSAASRFGS